MGAYDALFDQAAKDNGVDPGLLRAIAMSESSMNPKAASKDDQGNVIAQGLMGMTAPTAKALGVSDPTDPKQSIPAAAKLLRQNLDASGGDEKTALLMYHGGTDQSNWGPKTQAYPNQVYNNLAKATQQSLAGNDPTYQFLNGGEKSSASAAPSSSVDPVYEFLNSGGKTASGSGLQALPPETSATPQRQASTSLGEKIVGAGEAGLSMLTGAAGSAIGQLYGIGKTLTGGKYGTPEGAQEGEAAGVKLAQDLTYQPRTQAGNDLIGAIGGAIDSSKIAGLPADAQMLSQLSQVPRTAAANAPAYTNRLTTAVGLTKENPALGLTRESGFFPFGPKPNYRPNGDGTFTEVPRTATPPAAQTMPGSAQPAAAPGSAPQPNAAQPATPQAPVNPPSLATATPQLQAAIAKEKGPIDPVTLGRHLEADSLPIPMSLTKGQATQDINQLSAEQNMRGKAPDLAKRFNEQNGQLIQNTDAIRDAAAPDVTATNHIENGQALIDSYNAKDAALSADISAKYKALEDANGGKFPVDGSTFVKAADDALAAKMKTSFLPPEIRSIMDGIKSGDQPMNLQNFEELRTTLAAAARKAERSGDGNQAMAVSQVRNALESLPMTGEAANIKPLADAARSAAKARFDLLNSDPAYKAAVNGTVEPDDFIRKFVVGGKKGDLQAMKANLADDPLAQQTISAGAMNWLKSKAGIDPVSNTGNFTQAGYNKGVAALEPRMGEIFTPDAAQQVKTLGNVARYTQAQPRGSYVNNSNTFVSQAAHTAAGAVEGVVNVAAHGVPIGTWTRNALASRIAGKEVENILKPGAGAGKSR